jgi:galactonate dehydratase
MRNWIFVRVETNEPGLVGWGEASTEWHTRAVVGAVEDAVPFLVGEDPRRIEHLWQVLFRQRFFRGGLVPMSAMSGVDQALWDISAKELGVPLWRLLGGNVRDRVRMYDHLGGGDPDAVYGEATTDAFAERAARSVEDGFTALKILAVGRTRPLEGAAAVGDAESLMRTVREVVGPDVDVMVDLHGRTSAAMAIEYGRALLPYRPWFLEEPVQPGDPDAMAQVARALPVPIAAGERLVSRWEFRELLERRAIAVAQPDVCHAGGVSELRRISALADTYGAAVAPHNPLGPIATMVNVHLALVTPNFLVQEVMRNDVPWRNDVVDGMLPIEAGHVGLPERIGIGIEVNEREAARHPFEPEPVMRWFHEDGAVADW